MNESTPRASLGADIPRVPVLGVPFAQVTRDRLARYSIEALETPETTVLFAVHVVGVNILGEDREFERALRRGDLMHADGTAVMLVAWAAGQRIPERITTQDYMYDTLAHAAEHGHSVFLLGGPPGLAANAGAVLAERYPGLTIAGTRDGYFTPEQDDEVVREIRDSGAHFLLVGMGCPREHVWVADHADATGVRLAVTCGGTFGYIVGDESRCPNWIHAAHLEWAWRMAQDPKRLAKRYLGGIPKLARQMSRARREARSGS